MKTAKRILFIALALVLAVLVAAAAIAGNALFQVSRRTKALRQELSPLMITCPESVSVSPVVPVTQQISCGYAVLEMVGTWAGVPVTEQGLYDAYGEVVTSTASGFLRELNRQLPGYEARMEAWLPDREYLQAIYDSLEAGYPVPIQWAALLEDCWTLHYSLVTAMDLPGNSITVLNPYGYEEILTPEELLERTRFDAYQDMPLWMRLAFGFDVFQKNTLFLMTESG